MNFYSLFTPVASIYANLSEQKKAFIYKSRVQLLHDWLADGPLENLWGGGRAKYKKILAQEKIKRKTLRNIHAMA